ncbi:hypothetical protein PO909_019770 [Leuciscus waleckii]
MPRSGTQLDPGNPHVMPDQPDQPDLYVMPDQPEPVHVMPAEPESRPAETTRPGSRLTETALPEAYPAEPETVHVTPAEPETVHVVGSPAPPWSPLPPASPLSVGPLESSALPPPWLLPPLSLPWLPAQPALPWPPAQTAPPWSLLPSVCPHLLFVFLLCPLPSAVDWFPISSGVRQGCVAAPDLFNCIIDHLMSRVCERVPGVSFGSYHLTDLEYADDTILLSTSYSQLRDALCIYCEEAEKLGLQVSWTKTKFMYVGDRPHPPSLRLGNNIVEPVKNFVYLGSIVTDNGDLKPEITRRRALAASALQSLWKPLWRHQTISRKTKLRIYNSAVLSILLYGSETWPLNKTLAARLDGFDSRALRTIENIRWPQRVSNQVLRARTCQPRASCLAAQCRTRWFGHVLRLPPDHPTRAILQFDPRAAGWRRPRGRPRTRWLDVLAGDLQQHGVAVEDAEQLAQDRHHWKQLVHLVGSTHRDGTPPYPSQEPK